MDGNIVYEQNWSQRSNGLLYSLKMKENHTNELEPTNHILHKACNAHTWMHMI
jgi:hypothetical protein